MTIILFFRVATARGIQGIWMFIFSNRGNAEFHNIKKILHKELSSNTGNMLKF